MLRQTDEHFKVGMPISRFCQASALRGNQPQKGNRFGRTTRRLAARPYAANSTNFGGMTADINLIPRYFSTISYVSCRLEQRKLTWPAHLLEPGCPTSQL